MTHICKICDRLFEDIPEGAVLLGGSRGTKVWRFKNGDVHILKIVRKKKTPGPKVIVLPPPAPPPPPDNALLEEVLKVVAELPAEPEPKPIPPPEPIPEPNFEPEPGSSSMALAFKRIKEKS
jgi:hypothetical protein